ncbi:uncharacterized protein LOC133151320 [Syngnathus typhle]|uniref:uncharacterized protein LOC133151320 n=1 Tax=Syngnathus typhle TaxID=161592 RepID=UPI002A69C81B|nr:uncharacterized protein LOC133151320 [Syngnathus typhle]
MPAIVAFTALLLLSQQPADVPLAPPTNVTVNCTDTRGIVHWQYGEEAHVRFLVDVGNSKSKPERNATKQHFYKNITARVWESMESAMDVHYVSVAAVVPDGRLSRRISTTFTYNRVKMADVKCKLGIPDVDVKADNGSTTVSFRNPLRHDPQLRHATRGAATFRFNATYDSGEVEAVCEPYQNVCRANVTFPPGSDECVTLTGWVSDSGGGRLDFGPSRRICVKGSSGRATLLIGLPSVLTSVLVVGGLLICVVALVWRLVVKAPKEHLFPQVSACCQNWINWIQSCFAGLSELLPQEEEVEEVEHKKLKVEEDEKGKGCWGSNYDQVHENMHLCGICKHDI